MKNKSLKLILGVSIALILLFGCAFTAFAASGERYCSHYDSVWYGGDTYYCYDCNSYYTSGNYGDPNENDYYYDNTSSSTGDFDEVVSPVIGAVILTLLAPWIILGIIIFGLFIPTIATIIINLIIGIILFIVGAIIFILTPVIILVGVPVLVISLI